MTPSASDRDAATAPITPEVARVVHEQGTAFVATVNADGTPNLSPKGSLTVVDPTHLAFVDLRSPQTVRNVAARPAVQVNVVDAVRRTGYRFRGRATVLTAGAAFERVVAHYAARGFRRPIETVVLIEVAAVAPLVSPSYDDGTPEDEIVAGWAARLLALHPGPGVPERRSRP
ncbi:MAG: pyridoxamine 5'-phosphate oxidase family protein [Gemmatimonadaceae bacterium]